MNPQANNPPAFPRWFKPVHSTRQILLWRADSETFVTYATKDNPMRRGVSVNNLKDLLSHVEYFTEITQAEAEAMLKERSK